MNLLRCRAIEFCERYRNSGFRSTDPRRTGGLHEEMARGSPGRSRGSGAVRLRRYRRRGRCPVGRREGRVTGLGGQHPYARGPAVQEGPPGRADAHRHHPARHAATCPPRSRSPTARRAAGPMSSFWPTRPRRRRSLGEKFGYAAPLDDLVPRTVRDGFAPGSLDTCTFGGRTYCLRNDIAPTVLWYDAELMERYGYHVPSTWAEYRQTGLKAAAEHPGTIVGAVNGKYGAYIYFGSSGCPTRDTLSLTEVHIDLNAAGVHPGRRSAPTARPPQGRHHRRAHRPGLREVRQGRQDPHAAGLRLVRRLHVRARLQGAQGPDHRRPDADLARREQAVCRTGRRWRLRRLLTHAATVRSRPRTWCAG